MAREPRRMVILESAVFGAILVAISVAFGIILYNVLLERARGDTRSLVTALHEHVQRSIEISDLVADEVLELASGRPLDRLNEDAHASARIRNLAERLPGQESAIIVTDANGDVVLRSDQHSGGGVNFRDREWFNAHRSGADRHIGKALLSRITETPLYTYSKRINGADGTFAGVVNLGIPTSSIIGTDVLAHYPEGVSLTVFNSGGFLLARNPFSPALIDRAFSLPTDAGVQEGTVRQVRPVDLQDAIASFMVLPAHGLTIVASVPVSVALAPLRHLLLAAAPILFLSLAAMAFLARIALKSIDQRERANASLRQSLADNRVLFDEVHHRVKNNLQIVSSLLNQRARRLSPEAALGLNDAATRVRAMALVHEQIYKHENPSSIEIAEYLPRLVDNIKPGLSNSGSDVQVHLDLIPLTINLTQAIPIALLTTEVLTNCYKHAFNGRSGIIRVTLKNVDGNVRMEIQDNGCGLPGTLRDSLGMSIIRALSAQLHGKSGFESQDGTLFWLEWPRTAALSQPIASPRSVNFSTNLTN
jgi:two-component sensor histidine kinase